MTSEIRWYKGKYRVEIVLKSKVNYRVKALEEFPFKNWGISPFTEDLGLVASGTTEIGEEFTTVPRLLWRHKRE